MVKLCRGQTVTGEDIYKAAVGGNEQAHAASPVLYELLPNASFICT